MAAAKKTSPKPELSVLPFPSADAWRAWLDAHHASSPGLWIQLAKGSAGVASVTYAEAVEGALCYGWIDGHKRALDERYWLQRFTPRAARSKWSKINVEKAEALIAGGLMMPAGLREVERARDDGRWAAAYAGARTAVVPDDLRRALDADPQASAFFAKLDGANRYAILFRVEDAKRPETRARRIATFVAMLAKGEKLHP